MLNNEFRLIGTIVSDFEVIPNTESFPKKKFLIEVEGRKFPRQYPVVVYEKNGLIDTTQSLKGSVCILSGYIDSYKEFIQLIAQDLVVVGVGEPTYKEIKPSGAILGDPSVEKEEKPALDLTEDDLPF